MLETPIQEDQKDVQTKDSSIQIDAHSLRLNIDKYWQVRHKKKAIVLHFTAGTTAASAYNTFNNSPSRVATPYIIDRGGEIYEIYPPECWALHLFRHKKGEYPIYYQLEKSTIGIELVNVGPLKISRQNPQELCWWAPPNVLGQGSFSTRWCTIQDTDQYVKKSYRGMEYFASYTQAQYKALNKLLDHLCTRFGIPRYGPALKETADLEALSHFQGISAHQNYRPDKWDIGPAFDWGQIGL